MAAINVCARRNKKFLWIDPIEMQNIFEFLLVFHWFASKVAIWGDKDFTITICCCCRCCFFWCSMYHSSSQFRANRLKGLLLLHVCATTKKWLFICRIRIFVQIYCKIVPNEHLKAVWFGRAHLLNAAEYWSRAARTTVALNFNIKYYKLIDTEMVNANTEHDNRNVCKK